MVEAYDLLKCTSPEEDCDVAEDNTSEDSTRDSKALVTSEEEVEEDKGDTTSTTDVVEKIKDLEPSEGDNPSSTEDVEEVKEIESTEAREIAIDDKSSKEEGSGLARSQTCPVSGAEATDDRYCPLAEFKLPDSFEKHPAGELHINTGHRQRDAAGLLFLSYHMGADLNGKIASTSRTLGVDLPQRGQMYDEMHEAILKVRADHPNQRWYFHLYCGFLTIVLPIQIIFWMAHPSILGSVIGAFLFELYFLNIFHTRHHQGGRIYKNNFLHSLTTPIYEFVDSVWGYYPEAWRVNHHVKHHVYTNDTGHDTDVPAVYPYVRSCYDQPRLWFHKIQTFYWPLLTPFAAINFPINNFFVHGGSSFHFSSWIFIMYVLPYAIHAWHGICHSLLVQCVAGCLLAYKFAVSHAHPDQISTMTSPESYNDVDKWIQAQMGESLSYGGYFTTFVFGGINMQIEHHLCPALDPPMYHFMAPEIRRIAENHGIKYNYEPSFFHAVWSFHMKLWQMGWA
mmetsp:Transcript_70307/g.128774  ORF Transcript_70307/g.128774 Transcript_70307/m.128774 type:complete len:508 (+) Transcript_70307:58-1581(+)